MKKAEVREDERCCQQPESKSHQAGYQPCSSSRDIRHLQKHCLGSSIQPPFQVAMTRDSLGVSSGKHGGILARSHHCKDTLETHQESMGFPLVVPCCLSCHVPSVTDFYPPALPLPAYVHFAFRTKSYFIIQILSQSENVLFLYTAPPHHIPSVVPQHKTKSSHNRLLPSWPPLYLFPFRSNPSVWNKTLFSSKIFNYSKKKKKNHLSCMVNFFAFFISYFLVPFYLAFFNPISAELQVLCRLHCCLDF